jgi:hypothetical protein
MQANLDANRQESPARSYSSDIHNRSQGFGFTGDFHRVHVSRSVSVNGNMMKMA